MPANLRVNASYGPEADSTLKAYLERLVKLFPAEAVSIYIAGRPFIERLHDTTPDAGGAAKPFMLGWALFCLIGVLLVRTWATSDQKAGLRPQWRAVLLAAVSFVVWVYSFGDVFESVGWWTPLYSGLLVLASTFLVPFLYRGQLTPVPAPDQAGTAQPRPRPQVWGPMRATDPDQLSETDAEQAVLQGAGNESGARVSLSEAIAERFETIRQVRKLLGEIQDLLLKEHEIWVQLANAAGADLEALRTGDYAALARWTRAQVRAHGRPSQLILESRA